ncbi:MAG: PD-(D/E)XK nuclease family protein [Armatimonadota bacterium]
MGIVELWLGPAGSGKTGEALALLRRELDRDSQGVRYLVPTVDHKRSIEQLFLQSYHRQGLFGDPITTFFNFAEEVAHQASVVGRRLSETQKHLLLQQVITDTPVEYFLQARRFPGFVQALGETIDELKVHMVRPETLLSAAVQAEEQGAPAFSNKIREISALYSGYQTTVFETNLYDNEGIMWIAAERLRNQPELFANLRCLVLDGFARLTPIQLDFLRALAPRVPRIVVLFDYEETRPAIVYNPIQVSLHGLELLAADGLLLDKKQYAGSVEPRDALACLRMRVFAEQPSPCESDSSLALLIGATPLHEVELIARDVRALLRAGKLSDGTPVTPADIAILARNGDGVRERLARTFRRYGLSLRQKPPVLAQTRLGRALLATFRTVRIDPRSPGKGWQREDVLTLLRSGFLAIDAADIFQVDLTARSQYLRDGKGTWLTHWPEEEMLPVLQTALAPIAAFDDAYHRQAPLLEALAALVEAFRARIAALPPSFPDTDATAAGEAAGMESAFLHAENILVELQALGNVLEGFDRNAALDFFTTALLRDPIREPAGAGEGIPIFSVNATGGEKFKVVYLCNLLEGAFPLHQRESAFLMDHEREEVLRDLRVPLDPRRRLEDDEQFWFLHAVSTAVNRLVLSYPRHDATGSPLERSSFLDAVDAVIPALGDHARRTTFREVVPPLPHAESKEEYLGGLALALRAQRDAEAQLQALAAYTACPQARGASSELGALFRRMHPPVPQLNDTTILRQFTERARPFSATELQGYVDCPFLWFAQQCLALEELVEEFTPLDRGQIIHNTLERLYRKRQERIGTPVHLEGYSIDELWPEVQAELQTRLDAEPRFKNQSQFIRDIEQETLFRTMRRFLESELQRAQSRKTHPAFFEHLFGYGSSKPLFLCEGAIPVKGKIDRVDLADDDADQGIVVDYKSSTQVSINEMTNGRFLQLPIYALALERLFGLRALGAEFMSINAAKASGVYRPAVEDLYGERLGKRGLDPEHWKTLMVKCEENIGDAVAGMRAGQIALEPCTKRCPDGCAYFAVCRGNRYDLARKARENRCDVTIEDQ